MRPSALWLAVLLGTACARNYPAAAPEERLRDLDGSAAAPSLPSTQLDVLVWNVKKTQLEGWRDDFVRLSVDADLVLLQEAYDAPLMRDALADRTDMHWQMGVSFFYRRRARAATGVVTGGIAVSQEPRVLHAPAREPFTRTPKAVLLCHYRLEGRDDRLLVINIHAINFRGAKHLRAQLELVAPVIDEHSGPVIFAGDFNTHHRARLEVLEAFARTHHLRPAFENWKDGDPVDDARTRHLRWPLDHVYLRGLSVAHTRVHADTESSDHVPIAIRLDVD